MVYNTPQQMHIEIRNSIFEVVQTPDACVTACITAGLLGLGREFHELMHDLQPYVVPYDVDNPTKNPMYYFRDGILKVLYDHRYYTGVHTSHNNDQKSIYKGRFYELVISPPRLNQGVFTEETFQEYIVEQLMAKRYVLPWLDNRIYSPSGFLRNHYEQHVVTVYGVDAQKHTVFLMDPDSYLSGSHLIEAGISHLYMSLWRRSEQLTSSEFVMTFGLS